ncbi:uncharacterized protein [Littorina saxatilis]|uniref:uncharacterized protein n=1 Tax=Littorina saxatilis TaxID=31220 RepID=UPI0038B61E26
MQTLRYFGVDSSQYQQESLALRRSSREAKMTEKGKAYQMKLLTDNFRSDRDNLQAFLAETDHELQKEEVDCEDVIARRMKVTSLLTSLKETAERLKELSDTSEEDIDSALAEMTDASVTTMNKIVTATKHMYSHSSTRSHASHSSRRSKASTTSTTSSRRVAAAAETAALRVKLEAQHIENEGQEELEQLEFEEKMRRLNAERKMANLKRKHEAQKVETQLKMEEARLYALEQTSSSTSSRSSCKSTSSRTMPGRTDNNPTKQNLRAHASVFTPETHDENLVEALARAITSSRLPIPEPPIFTGDSLQYPDWSFSFTSLIENKRVPPEERIHFLKRYLGGPAKEAVSGFFMLRSKDAYQRARDILEQRFGNSYVISEAFRSKLDAWPKVHNKDKSGLRNLSDFLLQCQAAAAEVEDMKFLDDMREIKKITAKLPDWMVHTWNRKIAKSKRDKGRYPNFQEFASFVSEESEILNDPILSSEPSPVQPPVKQQIRKHGDSYTSQRTVLSTVAEDLQASSEPATLRLTTMTDSSVTISCQKYTNLKVRGFNSEKTISLPAMYSRDHIPLDYEHIPSPETASKWPHLSRLKDRLAPRQDCPVGILIGYNCPRALAPLNCVVGEGNQPYAVETELGWSIVGGTTANKERFDAIGHSHRVVTQEVPPSICRPEKSVTYVYKTQIKEVTATDLIKLMEQDFKDQSSDVRSMSQEDKKFLKTLEEGIHQRADGYYEMPLPFKNGEPKLPNNRQAALHRALALKRQFFKKPKYLQHYTVFMKEILDRGDAEKIPDSEIDTPDQWYIPHHGVYHPKKPDKVRVVFDCSARYQGVCINDHLLQGPDQINSLVGVLCRFREGPIAFTCDVEKMYHQFRVEKHHQDYLRFLWWEDNDLSKPPVDYRMKVHLFGATSSPGCANFALKHLANDHQHLGEKAADFLKNDFYVDDGLKGEFSVEEAKDLLEKARLICAKGNLRLHKVVSNNSEVMNSVPESERGSAVPASLNTDHQENAIERALGLQWCMKEDNFCFRLSLKDNPLTRRGILSTVAAVYDPLGLIAPVILVGKQILQSICKENLSWDHPIPEEIHPLWERWRTDIQRLKDVKIPRCYQPESFGTPTNVELHHFSDASLSGYGQCSYLQLKNNDGQVHCSLVMAKARVAPLKATTVPRLELQGAVLSVNTAKVLDAELGYPSITHHYWTDSMVVLGYIKNETARYHMYVANRVEQIRQFSQPQQWSYVPTSKNPADHASRGLSVDEISTSNWLTGPEFLWKGEITAEDIDIEISPQDVEVNSTTVFTTQNSKFTSFEEKIGRFSSYKKAVAAVAIIVKCCARKQNKQISALEANQIAKRNLIRVIQREAFGGACELKSKSNPLRDLDPFLDDDSLLRVGGRLRKTSELYGVKHPLILPKNSHLSRLIAVHHHEKTAHQGRSLTLNDIRSSGYWIIGCRRVTSSLINQCVTCIRHRGKARGQRMADLPKERVEPSPPFTYCGLDCFGPFIVKEGRKEVKRYGLIITCLAMRAVHIELLDDLTTDSFLNGLRCFIALRGRVRMIRCDQGTNFVGAKHELKENLRKLDHEMIKSSLLDRDCEFELNPPSSSHMGGVWERQIRNIRNVLTGILDHSASRLDTTSLRTFMYEAMAIVNSRPLTTENLERADGPLPLTPNHILTMKSGIIMPPPPGGFEKEDLYLKKRWRRVQFLADLFWTRWRREYLQTLQTRNTWQKAQRNICVGDIVLLQDDGICRADWKVAKVVETFPSDDGLVRKVRLLMATSELNNHGQPLHKRTYLDRPAHKLVVLLARDTLTVD